MDLEKLKDFFREEDRLEDSDEYDYYDDMTQEDYEERLAIENADCLNYNVDEIDTEDGNIYIAVTLFRKTVSVRFIVDGSEFEMTPPVDFLDVYSQMLREGEAEMGTGVLHVPEELAMSLVDAFSVTDYDYRMELWEAIAGLDNLRFIDAVEEQEMM